MAHCLPAAAQQVKFVEYDLDNGLHVILHQDKTAPVVAVSVMYHVGSKDEQNDRTGFAHFFEHLLFEGSENIKRGEFMKIVSSNGGQNNANTTQDRTFYYEKFPANQLELGLWLESERMLHPKIEEIGVKTQNEVVKEEKRMRMDNRPYSKFIGVIFSHLFKEHPYRWQPIGTMEHLDASKLSEFQAFFKKYYVPGNAVLTIAGDLDIANTKQLVQKYFSEVPKQQVPVKQTFKLKDLGKQIVDTAFDANIQVPAMISAYRVPGMQNRDTKTLAMIANLLAGSRSSRLNAKMIDQKRNTLQLNVFNYPLEDYGAFITMAIPSNNSSLDELQKDIDQEVERLQNDLISEDEFQKLRNQFENSLVSSNSTMVGLAENLSNAYIFSKKTSAVNEELSLIQSITKEDIREAARKYLRKNDRILLYYLPKSNK